MRPSELLVGILLLSLMVASAAVFIGDINSAYNVDMNDSDLQTYNKISEIQGKADSLEGKLEGQGLTTSGEGDSTMFSSSPSILSIIIGSGGMIKAMGEDFVNKFGGSNQGAIYLLVLVIISAIGIMITAYVASLWFKRSL